MSMRSVCLLIESKKMKGGGRARHEECAHWRALFGVTSSKSKGRGHRRFHGIGLVGKFRKVFVIFGLLCTPKLLASVLF